MSYLASAHVHGDDLPMNTDIHGDPLPPRALARIGTLRLRQGAHAYSAAFSPDGRLLAVGGTDMSNQSTTAIFEASTGKLVRRLPGHAHVVRSLAFSADSKLLASGGGDARLAVWQLDEGRRMFLSDRDIAGDAVTFLADGRTLAADGERGQIRLIDAATGKLGRALQGHTSRVFRIVASQRGNQLASCAMDGTVRIWDADAGKEIKQWQVAGNDKYGLHVAFSADDRRLACATYGGSIYVWDVAAGRELWHAKTPEDVASSVAFSPNGKELFTGRTHLRAIDAGTGKELRRFPMHQGAHHLVLSPDGKTVAVIGGDAEVRLFDSSTGTPIGSLDGHARGVLSVAFSPDGRELATASGESVFRLWDATSGKLCQSFKSGSVGAITFAPDGKTLAAAMAYQGPSFWETGTGNLVRQLDPSRGGGETVGRLAYTSNKHLLLAHSRNNHLTLWDPQTEKPYPHKFRADIGPPLGNSVPPLPFALAPDGKTIAVVDAVGDLGKILLWDLTTGKVVMRTNVRGSPWAFSPDGRLLAAQSNEKLFLVNAQTGVEVRQFEGAATLRRTVFAPDGFWLATAGAVFSPDGFMLATAGHDGTVRLWETASGQERIRFTGHDNAVQSVAFSPDGKRLASGGADMTALVWDVYGKYAGASRPARTDEAIWTDLADTRADRAFSVMCALIGTPDQAVALANARLQPTAAAEPKIVRDLLEQLDDSQFAIRANASKELQKIGHGAMSQLREAAADRRGTLEYSRRLDEILSRLNGWSQTAEGLHAQRAIEALGQIATPPARKALERLASGATDSPLTEAAKAELRLQQ